MGEFFEGWRRKAGVVVLVVTCVLALAWIRSQTRFDTVMFTGHERLDLIASHDGVVTWLSSWERHTISYPRLWPCRVSSQSIDTPKEGTDGKRFWQQLGFNYEHSYAGSEEGDDLQIPYWSVVIPLTLLSAHLLLSKPRQTKFIASIHSEPSSQA